MIRFVWDKKKLQIIKKNSSLQKSRLIKYKCVLIYILNITYTRYVHFDN
jgi:hypothetical protein